MAVRWSLQWVRWAAPCCVQASGRPAGGCRRGRPDTFDSAHRGSARAGWRRVQGLLLSVYSSRLVPQEASSMQIRRFFRLARKSVRAWMDAYASSIGAATAFYTVFSRVPLMLIVIGVAGIFWGEEAVRGELMRQVSTMVAESGAQA